MSHIFKSLDNDDMEVGQTTGQDLFMKLNRWGGECKINLDLTGDMSNTIQQISGDELRWTGNKFDFKFEKKTPRIEFAGSKKNEMPFISNERNGIELFIILREKPTQNYVEFPIDEENLNFYYQPPYTQEQIDAGHVRPPWIDSSYAVYHKTKSGHVVGKTNYMCGKAFHIYRPIVIDSNSNIIFGDLNIADGKMRITIDSDFIQNAVYPITIDPNFGYETQGTAGYSNVEDNIDGSVFLNNQGTGTGDSISACLYINNQDLKCALYSNDASPGAYIQTTDERTDIPEKAKDFYTFNFSSSPDIVNNTSYLLVAWGNETGGGGYGNLYYDSVPWSSQFGGEDIYGTWPATKTFGPLLVKFSIYCTFTISEPSGYVPKIIMIT